MRPVTVVTGPMRSGTSCVTGLLERCGFDLGQELEVLRNPSEHNPRGHFEVGLLFTINERLTREFPDADHDMFHPPACADLDTLAAQREHYFRLFVRQFDGELCKDPLMCLTWSHWERHWPALTQAVFCLRHPLAVARSMERRYGFGVAHGLALWLTYASRFFESVGRCRVHVLDFDAFRQAPVAVFGGLLRALGRPLATEDLRARIDDFFGLDHVHARPGDADLERLPEEIRQLHARLRALAIGGDQAERALPAR